MVLLVLPSTQVFDDMPISQAYDMFHKLSLRHLCVINHDGLLVGMLTRKDLEKHHVVHVSNASAWVSSCGERDEKIISSN